MATDFATAHAAYLDNAGYDVENSVTKARLFAVACRQLVGLIPTVSESDKERTEINVELIRNEQAEAINWLNQNDPDRANGSADVLFVDLRGGRC